MRNLLEGIRNSRMRAFAVAFLGLASATISVNAPFEQLQGGGGHVADAAHASAGRTESTPEIEALVAAYPNFLKASGKPNVVLWRDGSEWPFDDRVERNSYEMRLANPCLKDQMSMSYRPGWPFPVPGKDEDPGRIRYEPLFRKMYGETEKEVAKNIVAVPWPAAGNAKTVSFTRVNGASEALSRVATEIAALPDDVRRYAAKPIGTFSWRPIAGTNRLSMHSFGAAIDIEFPSGCHQFWGWEKKAKDPANDELKKTISYPAKVIEDEKLASIVRIFEKHGFIWGGKWYHYDTMHFEYRPELLPKS